eukprot:61308_1
MAEFFIVLYLFLTIICNTDVHISTNGIPWMCNNDPETTQSISTLRQSDQNLINKLEQVHAMHRHGSRVGSYPISTFLPNTDLQYNCNITSIVTRQYKQNGYYTENNLKQIFNLRKIYVKNEQQAEGNCQAFQSLKHLIPQQQANAHHIKAAYIGNKSHHLFDNSILNDISNNLITNAEDNRISLSSTDYERTLSSLSVVISELFFSNIDASIAENIIVNANIHDQNNDPYSWYSTCENTDEYKQWKSLIDTARIKSTFTVSNSKFANDTISAFESEGGIWFSSEVGNQLLYPYCAEMKLPLTNDTFWNAVRLSYDIDTVKDTNINQTECYYHFLNIPMLNKIYNYINMMKQNSYPKLVLHSVHDLTIIRVLQSFGIYDYNLIMFGELVTLELYSAFNQSDLYYFRFTRKGEFIPYPTCDYQNGQTELCDLNVLLERSFKNIISTKEWVNKCNTLITDCVCGYCDSDSDISTTMMYTTYDVTGDTTQTSDNECENTVDKSVIDPTNISFWIGIGIGVGIGIILGCCSIILIRRYCCGINENEKFLHNQYYLEEETYKL